MRAAGGVWTPSGVSRFTSQVAPPAQLVGKHATTCVEDETVDSSERFCCEELDLVLNLIHIVSRMSLSAILASVSTVATRRIVRPHLQSHAPRAHSSTHFVLSEQTDSSAGEPCCGVCSSLACGFGSFGSSFRCFELPAFWRRVSRATVVFNDLLPLPRGDSHISSTRCSTCAYSYGISRGLLAASQAPLSAPLIARGSRWFQSCGGRSGLPSLCHSWSALCDGLSEAAIVIRGPSASKWTSRRDLELCGAGPPAPLPDKSRSSALASPAVTAGFGCLPRGQWAPLDAETYVLVDLSTRLAEYLFVFPVSCCLAASTSSVFGHRSRLSDARPCRTVSVRAAV